MKWRNVSINLSQMGHIYYIVPSNNSYLKYLIVQFIVKAGTRLRPTVAQAENIPCTKIYTHLYINIYYVFMYATSRWYLKVVRWTFAMKDNKELVVRSQQLTDVPG